MARSETVSGWNYLKFDVKAWVALFSVALTIGGFLYATGGVSQAKTDQIRQAQVLLDKQEERVRKLEDDKADRGDLKRLEDKIDRLDGKMDRLIDRELAKKK